ncbi:MAG: glycyl-radical enzyme activating protein [Anaerolineae bacterium]|nr:glycyl-radical enzyme activating protein [Anaerolineae bacterium]
MTSGIVTNIQRFSIHDGPGIRTTVFLKGCNLRCFWCHNPETWNPKPELQLFLNKCIGCGECFKVCPNGCHEIVDGLRQFNRLRCTGCGTCTETCYAEALVLAGEEMTVDQVMQEVLADKAFYETSNGGITLSGGEPALQVDFSYALLERSKMEGVHTAIETDANYSWKTLERLLEVTDFVMTDIKHMDPDVHKAATGVTNTLIIENHKRLMATDKPVVFRTPVIPTINATAHDIGAIAAYVRDLCALRKASQSTAECPSLDLLPFHRLAADKYRSLDLEYEAVNLTTPSREEMLAYVDIATAYGIDVKAR